jgi:protocatechuate 3,4-dioxygenase beta subunit
MTDPSSHDHGRPPGLRTPRRTILRAAGGAGLLGAVAALTGRSGAFGGATAAGSTTSEVDAALQAGAICDLTPESAEGPFYLPDELVRDDIRENRKGVLLTLRFHVMNANTCEPLRNAAVDIWQCDALGEYSGVAKRAEGEETDDSSTFLRGIQLSRADGRCDFTTIVPGWYPGRTTHIHTKVHVRGEVSDHHYLGGHVSHTGQVFFTERLMKTVEKLKPYSESTTTRLHNDQDSIFQQAGGSSAIAKTTQISEGHPRRGYAGTMVLAVDPKPVH